MHFTNHSTKIYVYSMPVLDSRMYIMPNNINSEEALIIDPIIHKDALSVLDSIQSAIVLLTHAHYDHISGVNWLRSQISSVSVKCSEICAEKIQNPHKNLAAYAATLVIGKPENEQKLFCRHSDFDYHCQADETFPLDTSFSFGDYRVSITYTPGHSNCSQCITLTSENPCLASPIVFTGDSLVNGHPVITRLPTGSKKDYIEKTAPFLDAISDDTIIMPGHGDWGKKCEM